MVVKKPAGFQTRNSFDDLDIMDKLMTEQKTALGRGNVPDEQESQVVRPKKIPALHLKPDEQMYDDMMTIMEYQKKTMLFKRKKLFLLVN